MLKAQDQNLQEWLEVVDAVYSGNGISREALFVHGWTDLVPETMEFVAELYRESGHPAVVLNGLSSYGIGAPGFSECRELLVAKGVAPSAIYEIGEAKQTAEEARGFMTFAKSRGISSATIVTVPQHLLRAFLVNLAFMQAERLELSLYPRTLPRERFEWEDTYEFMPLLRKEPERATRLARFAAECVRIIDYRARFEAGDEAHRIANISEAHRYLHAHQK